MHPSVPQVPTGYPHPAAELSTRLLGVWPAESRTHTGQAFTTAVERLVTMCVDQRVLPTANPVIATFADRQEILLCAYRLRVGLLDLLALAEPIGFGPDRTFVAAVVDVRPFDLDQLQQVAA